MRNRRKTCAILCLICTLSLACSIGVTRRGDLTPIATSPPTSKDTVVFTTTPTMPPSTIAPAATATPTPSPTTPPPTPTATPEPPPAILSFTADPMEINIGDSITLAWNSTGVRAILKKTTALAPGSFERDVPPSGSMVVTASSGEGGHWHDFELTVFNSVGESATSALTVRFHCAHTFFFTTSDARFSRLCPSGPAESSWAAEQIFEHGRMIWMEHGEYVYSDLWGSGDYDGEGVIFVLYDSSAGGHQVQVFVDTWTSAEPESDPSIVPPAGLYQPIRGFGKVWRNNPEVRDRLGWAVAPEEGFETLYQEVTGFEWNNACRFIRIRDGRAVAMCRRSGGWNFVP
jgi:hypothetical protein